MPDRILKLGTIALLLFFAACGKGAEESTEAASAGGAELGVAGASDENKQPTVKPESAFEQSAFGIAEQWLALIDQEKYEASWDSTSDLFKKHVTKEKWAESIPRYRRKLGQNKSRRVISKELTDQVGQAPKGKYFVLEYASSFSKRPNIVEKVIFTKDADASWRVVSYSFK